MEELSEAKFCMIDFPQFLFLCFFMKKNQVYNKTSNMKFGNKIIGCDQEIPLNRMLSKNGHRKGVGKNSVV